MEQTTAGTLASPWWRRVVWWAAIGYALVAAAARPLTGPAAWAVLAPGVALLLAGLRRTPVRRPRVGRRAAVTWLGLGVLFCLWELGAFLAGNDDAHPTFSILTDSVLATYPGRVVGYLLWLGTGAWLVTR
ncbi:hypothetical protein Q2K19_04750 [Micromonospora soli]|uniref:hypothetical protein n=1 Tax=Micromonospora sp. NBRC 110009 TaxID=3061627 RepID=UPI002673A785|nr:hypothetical protein [Micromonospora sp. NBRC 110009]WKT99803.1 hypothetical protein Q2K19_04750 [Micromonospora sp. NBRC 110009]